MNYKWLQLMVDSLIEDYKCECWASVTEEDVDIMWAAWNNVNIDISCSKCWKHTMMKSRLIVIKPENIWTIKENLLNIKEQIETEKSKNTIKDKYIVDLSKNLKNNNIAVSDLFN